jgi:hypothetical protein
MAAVALAAQLLSVMVGKVAMARPHTSLVHRPPRDMAGEAAVERLMRLVATAAMLGSGFMAYGNFAGSLDRRHCFVAALSGRKCPNAGSG